MYFEHFEPGLDTFRQILIARFALDPLMPKAEQLSGAHKKRHRWAPFLGPSGR